jgi:hypothetical protein
MKKFLSVIVVCVATTLASCGTLGIGTPSAGGTTSPSISDIIAGAQAAAVSICGFAPAGNIVASIIGAGVPGIMAAAAIGSAICAAFAPPPLLAKKGGKRLVRGWTVTPGAVNGVPIR